MNAPLAKPDPDFSGSASPPALHLFFRRSRNPHRLIPKMGINWSAPPKPKILLQQPHPLPNRAQKFEVRYKLDLRSEASPLRPT